MDITIEKAWELLKENGIETEEELEKKLKENPIEIGMFTSPFPRELKEIN
ncbi:hypothetical protein NSA50_19510 [Clostridium sp. DSM 100503]|nr:hypothetical protein [Clostridium sp. DSM 100503]MCR1953176.1 hypothetical protein [Clostridium sp. DSM 100503]